MINQSRYVKIVSGVGAGAVVAQRRFVLRLITQNVSLPPGVVVEFSNPDSVGSYFGLTSEEYKRAQAYFSFVSKLIKSPGMISFARWVSTAIAPMVVGDSTVKSMGTYKSVTAGAINFTIDGESVTVNNINLAATNDFAAVASALQLAITAAGTTANNDQLKTATVAFNATTNQFIFTGGLVGSGVVTVAAFTGGTDLGELLGWNTTGAVPVAGQTADTPDGAVQKSSNISNNFGSFAFTTPSVALTDAQIAQIAAWNHSQNNMYMYCVPVTIGRMGALYALVKGFSGTALTIIGTGINDYSEQCPSEILASTDYTTVNATQNYMYYQFPNRAVTVSDDSVADQADLNRANYIGVTQSAGQQLAFYQRGVLCGGSTDAVDMSVYANEMWMKSAISSLILQTFLALPEISADAEGKATLLGVIQSVINTASENGVIANGKDITITQQQYISTITGDAMAWRQVSLLGYWIDCDIKQEVKPNGITEYYADYTLVYAKGDVIRSVSGRDVLI